MHELVKEYPPTPGDNKSIDPTWYNDFLTRWGIIQIRHDAATRNGKRQQYAKLATDLSHQPEYWEGEPFQLTGEGHGRQARTRMIHCDDVVTIVPSIRASEQRENQKSLARVIEQARQCMSTPAQESTIIRFSQRAYDNWDSAISMANKQFVLAMDDVRQLIATMLAQ